jgi:arginine exporter protein ArgO
MRLPERPVTFITVYVLMSVFTVMPTLMRWLGSAYAAWFGASALISFHCLFVAQLAQTLPRAAGEQGAERTTRRVQINAVRIMAFIPPLTFILVGLYRIVTALYAGSAKNSFSENVINAAGAFASIIFFAVIWLSAKLLCREEKERNLGNYSVLGTFILMLYAIFGVLFIYPRVRRLREAEQPLT